MSDRRAAEQGVKFAFEAMQAREQIATPRKEQEMNEARLGWFDRLLMKVAVAKAAARGENPDTAAGLLMSGLARINGASARTSQSGAGEARQ